MGRGGRTGPCIRRRWRWSTRAAERLRLKVLPTCLLCFSWEGGRRRRLGGSPFGCGGGTPQPGTPLVGSFSGGSFSGGSFSAEGGGTHSEGRVVLGSKEKGVAAAWVKALHEASLLAAVTEAQRRAAAEAEAARRAAAEAGPS